jgi:hypothetical protein
MFSRGALTVMLIAANVTGCAALPPAQPAGDLRAIAGKWEGTVSLRDGRTVPSTLTINEDGTWESLMPALSSPGPRFVGSMTVVGGKYRSKSDTTGRTGTYTLHEVDGKRVLVGVADDHFSSSEYKPAK